LYQRTLVAILACAALASGQRLIEFSARIGVPLTDSFETGTIDFLGTGLQQGSSATRRYTAGLGVALRLPRGFGVEADVLYKRLGYDRNFNPSPDIPVYFEHTWTTANSWEFPMQGTYRWAHFQSLPLRFAGGVSFRALSGVSTTGECYVLSSEYSQFCESPAPTPQPEDSHLNARSSFGATFSAGVERPVGPVRLNPEIRYTRWRRDTDASTAPFDLRSNPNQLDFLLGVRF
jgi:hypothetical protein